ncbi:MAG: DUF3089 domain-containing protein, partial [Lentisphaeria bacterium]|nr:DUF3089 domain-containing protein [Lentisphaeria bacterium]
MNWRDDPKLRAKTTGFAGAQTGIFGGKARIFAPYVRQLDYSRGARTRGGWNTDWRSNPELAPGAEDTAAAFRHYLRHFNSGRPYILLGHSQGSIDLYRMMMRLPEVAVGRGFVAAYLLGMPRLKASDIAADFSARGIRPAADAAGLGVIIGGNTPAPGGDNPPVTGNGTYSINPHNRRTDGTPADK